MPDGAWIVLAAGIPNLAWFFFPSPDRPAPGAKEPLRIRLFQALETLARAAVFTIPFFNRWEPLDGPFVAAFLVMGVSLAVYYLAWLRYFLNGRRTIYLWMSLAGLPVPLAVSPTVFFLAASVPLGSWPLAVASLLLGLTHIPLSLRESRR